MRAMLAIFLLVPALSWAQLTPSGSLGFDFKIVDIPAVSRFEMQLDGGTFVGIGIPPVRNDAQTQVGNNTFAIAASTLTLTAGTHTFAPRACTTTSCFAATSPPLTFTYVLPLPAPSNLRVLP